MSNKYHEFFIESPEGIQYIRILDKMITQEHEKAEKSPELAMTFTQRAKGIREARDMAVSMSTEVKKPD
jgi:hypothetical protein